MEIHSSVLDWKIPWTEEPSGPQSMGLQSQTRSAHAQAQVVAYLIKSWVFSQNLNDLKGIISVRHCEGRGKQSGWKVMILILSLLHIKNYCSSKWAIIADYFPIVKLTKWQPYMNGGRKGLYRKRKPCS